MKQIGIIKNLFIKYISNKIISDYTYKHIEIPFTVLH